MRAPSAKRRFGVTLLAGCGALTALLVACDDDDPPVASVTPVEGSGAVVVVAEAGAFSIGSIEVQGGTTTAIALENGDSAPHTLTVYLGASAEGETAADTGEVGPGERGEAVVFFSSPGLHAFRCEIHPDKMSGTLIVR